MRYIKLTFQYIFSKNFWKLALLSVIPSILMSFVSTFSSTIKLFINFFQVTEFNFKTIHDWVSDLNSSPWTYYLEMFGIMLLLSLLLSIFIGTMQRHMRTGKFQITNILKRINENIMPSFASLACVYALIFIYGILVSLVTSLWFTLTGDNIATFVLSLIFMIVAFVIMVFIISLFSMTAPNIVCTGQKVRDSVSLSIRTVGPKTIDVALSFIVPLIPLFALQIGISFTNISWLQKLADIFMMIAICCYYPTLIFVTYYDLFDRDREDLLPENRL